MDSFLMLALVVFLPFILTPVVPLAHKVLKHRVGWFAAAVAAVCFTALLTYVPTISGGGTVSGSIEWIPSLNVCFSLYADGLALLLGLIVSFIGIMIMSYSNGYLGKEEDLVRYYQYLLMFMGSMFGVAFSDNLIQLFVFWELTSISSFLLIGYYRHVEKSIYGATKALLITAGGGLFMLAGFMCLYTITGTYGISEMLTSPGIIQTVKADPLFTMTLVLILIGCFAKSAQGPFFIWLPNAMEAPTPVSAFLHSATMVKAGVFLVARLHPMFSGTDAWLLLVTGIGLLTMVGAGFLALRQTDLKGILAFSTVSQLAYLMTMFGFTTAAEPGIGVSAAVFHLLNHASFKACLFLLVGIIAHEMHTRDIRKMGGLFKEMPVTFITMVIAAAAMAGVPPLNGFLSKEMFYESAYDMGQALGGVWTYLIPGLAVLGGIFTFMYSFRLIHKVFLGRRCEDADVPKHVHDPHLVMIVPPVILGILIIAIGLFPDIFVDRLVMPAVLAVNPAADHIHAALWHGVTPAFIMTVITFILGILFYTQYSRIAAFEDRVNEKIPWFSLNFWYNRTVDNAARICAGISGKIQRGPPFLYTAALLLFAVFLIAVPAAVVLASGGTLTLTPVFSLPVSEYVLLALIIITAAGAAFMPRYLVSVMSISMTGFLVAALYAYLKAPDLAMTQLCVETLSTIIFLVAIMKLRTKSAINPDTAAEKALKAAIAVLCGAGIFIMMLSTGLVEPFDTFSHYFMENGIGMTAGRNIVNVIVVDFRGYDTIGEISVLTLAALGVYNLIKSTGAEDKEQEDEQ